MAILCGLHPRYLEWVERPVSALPARIARCRAVDDAVAGINDTDPIDRSTPLIADPIDRAASPCRRRAPAAMADIVRPTNRRPGHLPAAVAALILVWAGAWREKIGPDP